MRTGWVWWAGYPGGGYLLPGTGLAPRLILGSPGWVTLAGPGTLAGHPRLSSHRRRTQTCTRVQSQRVEIHERGGSAKGFLVMAESKSSETIRVTISLEEGTPFLYRCFSK